MFVQASQGLCRQGREFRIATTAEAGSNRLRGQGRSVNGGDLSPPREAAFVEAHAHGVVVKQMAIEDAFH